MHLVHGKKVFVIHGFSHDNKLLFKFPFNNVIQVKLTILIAMDLNFEVIENGKV
jgi:hypothetical protein